MAKVKLMLIAIFALFAISFATKEVKQDVPLPLFFYSNLKMFKTKEAPPTSIYQLLQQFVTSISKDNSDENLKILVFNIKTKFDSIQTMQYLRKIDNQLKTIKLLFNDKESGVIYTHLDYSIKDVTEEMISELNQREISTRTNIYDFDNSFRESHEANLQEKKNSVEVLNVDLSSIVELDSFLMNDLKILNEETKSRTYSVIILFEKSNSNESSQNSPHNDNLDRIKAIKNSRVLLENTEEDVNPYAPSSPSTLTGLIVGFIFIFILLVGSNCLASLETPEQFASTPYSIGRES